MNVRSVFCVIKAGRGSVNVEQVIPMDHTMSV